MATEVKQSAQDGELIPFVVPLTVVLGGAAFWPFFERRGDGDRRASSTKIR